jgi:hypothetical protein
MGILSEPSRNGDQPDEAMAMIFEYIGVHYNRKRR